jgi:hypothetical protein
MVGKEGVPDMSDIKSLPQGAGKTDALKPKGNFERSPHLGYTYFVRAGDAIKIGHTTKFNRRLHHLRSGSGEPLEVLAVVPETVIGEYEAHRMFDHLRLNGEWFRADPELLGFIEAKCGDERKGPMAIEGLHALRRRHGASSLVGYRCSNLIQMIPHYQAETDAERRAHLAKNIQIQMTDIARLLAS